MAKRRLEFYGIRKRALLEALLVSKRVRQLFDYRQGVERQTIFVAGVQRSGTNMLMDVLEKSFETDVYHEYDGRAFCDYEMREINVVRDLYHKSKARFFVIKCLCELQDLGQLLEAMQPAKAVWIVRRYQDVVNSMLKSFPSQAAVIRRLSQDRNGNRWIGKGMSDSTWHLLRSLAVPDISDASSAALIWYLRNMLFFEQHLDRDPRVLVISYEDLVSSPMETLKLVGRRTGMQVSERLVADIFSDSIRKRPDPVVAEPIQQICSELHSRFDEIIARP